MTLIVEEVTDRAGVARCHAIEARCIPHDYAGMPAFPLVEAEAMALGPQRSDRSVLFIVSEEGVDVATGVVWLPLRDNLESASLLFSVDPAHRRRGIGGDFATELIAWARRNGRSRLRFMAPAPLDGPALTEPLARRLGAELALEMVLRVLDVGVLNDAALDKLLADHVAGHADAYDVVTWVDRVPDLLVEGAAYLLGRMSTDAPMGTVEWEQEVWDAERYREKETETTERHRRRVAAGAVERQTGRLVAYTDIGVSNSEPEWVDQWDTIVDPDHRGQRIGMLIKVANLQHLRQVEPRVKWISTFNAASNAHMVAINELLGFRPTVRSMQWQVTGVTSS